MQKKITQVESNADLERKAPRSIKLDKINMNR